MGLGCLGGKHVTETRVVDEVFDLIVKGDGEIVVTELLKNNLKIEPIDPSLCRSSPQAIKDFAVKGAVGCHTASLFPRVLITEIETYRGCPRSIVGGCSFCSEPSKGLPQFPDH